MWRSLDLVETFRRLQMTVGAFLKSMPYVAGEALHTGWGPLAQAAYENRSSLAAEAKVRLVRQWRLPLMQRGA